MDPYYDQHDAADKKVEEKQGATIHIFPMGWIYLMILIVIIFSISGGN